MTKLLRSLTMVCIACHSPFGEGRSMSRVYRREVPAPLHSTSDVHAVRCMHCRRLNLAIHRAWQGFFHWSEPWNTTSWTRQYCGQVPSLVQPISDLVVVPANMISDLAWVRTIMEHLRGLDRSTPVLVADVGQSVVTEMLRRQFDNIVLADAQASVDLSGPDPSHCFERLVDKLAYDEWNIGRVHTTWPLAHAADRPYPRRCKAACVVPDSLIVQAVHKTVAIGPSGIVLQNYEPSTT